jgi:tetratricopeptide (TPR) repeat protein
MVAAINIIAIPTRHDHLKCSVDLPFRGLLPMSRKLPSPIIPAVLALLIFVTSPEIGSAQDHHHPADSSAAIGQVEFATTCAPAVAERMEQAVAMLHSFWFAESVRAFREIAAADPACAMAHWGIAMTEMGNPMARVMPSAEAMLTGLAASERARDLAQSQSHREQMYAATVLAYFSGAERDHGARMAAHEEALAALHRAHPEDAEATIFYARAVVANAPPTDLNFSRQRAGAELILPLFEANRDHPGLAHYIIHAFDAPALASLGVDAAFAYAEIAPAAPHALHMPSHIFTRLGYWKESIETNSRSAAAEPDPNAAVHPMDYMVYAYLQLGMDSAAKEVVDRAVQNSDRYYGGALGYNFVAMPARYALERGAWREAAGLRLPVNALPHVEAITHFARAVGSARSGDAGAAASAIEALAKLQTTLEDQGDSYWATIVAAQRLAAEAWVSHARGDEQGALRLAERAAALEETVEKHPVTPGPILPARELLGDLLLEVGRSADAFVAYETTLKREPNRARTLFGAARAAELAGDGAAARRHYTALLELMREADASRTEAQAARAFLNSR